MGFDRLHGHNPAEYARAPGDLGSLTPLCFTRWAMTRRALLACGTAAPWSKMARGRALG